MNAAVLRKTARDYRWPTIIICAAIAAFPVLLIHAFSTIPWDMMRNWLEIPVIARLIRAIAGADLSEAMNINTLGGFVFVHPVMLALVWSYVIMIAMGSLCGEIDRGTADVLLTLPHSRFSVYLSISAWLFMMCAVLMLCAWLGICIGDHTAGLDDRMDLWSIRRVVVNAIVCHLAVAGVALLAAAMGSRRGRVAGAVFGILLASFLLNSLAAFWPSADRLSVLGLLHYFRPIAVIRDGVYQTGDMLILSLVTIATWSAGAIIFTRRDIPAA